MSIELGDLAKDIITRFEGVVVGHAENINNCDRMGLQPRELKDGSPVEPKWFDITQLELVEKAVIPTQPLVQHPFKIMDTVRDTLSPCIGKVTGFVMWVNGCVRATVAPSRVKDGIPVDDAWLPVQQIEIVKAAEKVQQETKTGGPMKDPRGPKDPRR